MTSNNRELTRIKTHPYERELARIKHFLKGSAKGYTVTEISHEIDINRNSVAKYLDVLCSSGIVELKIIGSAKIYSLTKRIPISSILSLSSDYILILDEDYIITYVNEKVLNFEKKASEDVIGKSIDEAGFVLLSTPNIPVILAECTHGKDVHQEIEVHNNGDTWYFRAKFIPSILEDGKRGILIILDDITEIKKYQRDLEKTVEDRTDELTHSNSTLHQEIISHKEVKDAFEESERKYQTIVETSPNGILVYDLDGIIKMGNIQAAGMLGYEKPGELIGKNIFDYISPIDLEKIREQLKKTLAKGFTRNFECKLISKDSASFCAELSISTIPDQQGRPSGFVSVLSDITERREAEYLVRKSEEKHRSLVEGISHIIFTTDTKGRFTYVSPVIHQVLGYAPAELTGKHFYILVPSEERHVVGEKLKEAMDGKLGPNDFRMMDKSGTLHWGRMVAQPLIEREKIRGITGLIGDITDLKHTEQALQESEEKLNLAIRGSGLGLWDWRVQTGEMVVNDRWSRMIGYEVQELSPVSIDTWLKLIYPEDLQKSRDVLQEHFAGERADYECEYRMMHKDGHWVWVLDRGMVTERDKDGKPVRMTGTHLDISERKKADEALRQVNRKLNLLSSLTRHDILNKISILLGYLDRAKTVAQDHPTILEYLDRLQTSTDAIAKLVRFTRDYKDLGMTPPQWFSLKDILKDAPIWMNAGSADLKNIRLAVYVGTWEIYADPQIKRVFQNIFENARIHGKNVTEMKVECRKHDRGLSVIIQDDGIGVSEEIKKEIFEPAMTQNKGLGLFLAKEILSITGLTIEENGAAVKGARFEINVPSGCFRTQETPAFSTKRTTLEVIP